VILVASDVLIAHLRGLAPARGWLGQARERTGRLAISVISLAEITGGTRSTERREVWRLFSTFQVIEIDEVIARRAGEHMRRYRRSHAAIGIADYLVAATADVRGLELATLNVRHFPMFRGLRPPFRVPLGDYRNDWATVVRGAEFSIDDR
jgi:predicted nucleic acid-binding protein